MISASIRLVVLGFLLVAAVSCCDLVSARPEEPSLTLRVRVRRDEPSTPEDESDPRFEMEVYFTSTMGASRKVLDRTVSSSFSSTFEDEQIRDLSRVTLWTSVLSASLEPTTWVKHTLDVSVVEESVVLDVYFVDDELVAHKLVKRP